MPTHLLLKGTTLQADHQQTDQPARQLLQTQLARATIVEIHQLNLTPDLLEQISATRTGLVVTCDYPQSPHDLTQTLELAKHTRARALNIQFKPPLANTTDATHDIHSILTQAHEANVPLCFETTADLLSPNYINLLQATPQIRFTLNLQQLLTSQTDLSTTSDPQAVLQEFSAVLNRTDTIRCTSSTAQAPVNNENQALFNATIWSHAMRQWRQRNPAGSTMLALVHPNDDFAWQTANQAWKLSARPA